MGLGQCTQWVLRSCHSWDAKASSVVSVMSFHEILLCAKLTHIQHQQQPCKAGLASPVSQVKKPKLRETIYPKSVSGPGI